MRGGGGAGQLMSRGARIAVAVAVGVALGCVCAFLYPDGLISRAPDSALRWPHRVRSPPLVFCSVRAEFEI
jgi:arabinosyltransferase